MAAPKNNRRLVVIITAPPPPPRPASHTVFLTNELLCGIVSLLPMKDIITTTIVCHHWRWVLKDAPEIKEALFLKAAKVSEILEDRKDGPEDSDDAEGSHAIQRYRPHVALRHPLTLATCGAVQSLNEIGDWQEHTFEPFYNGQGSWREMFVTQPPCKTYIISVSDNFEGEDVGFSKRLFCEEGLKLGQVYDFVRASLPVGCVKVGGAIHVGDFVGSKAPVEFVYNAFIDWADIIPFYIPREDSEDEDEDEDDDDDDDEGEDDDDDDDDDDDEDE